MKRSYVLRRCEWNEKKIIKRSKQYKTLQEKKHYIILLSITRAIKCKTCHALLNEVFMGHPNVHHIRVVVTTENTHKIR